MPALLKPVKAKNRTHLKKLIKAAMDLHGPKVDLNHIDVSSIEDMSMLFVETKFKGDISKWETHNVKTMVAAFARCPFNGDISNWNVSNVVDMTSMFAFSKAVLDLSRWDVSNVKIMDFMFAFGSGKMGMEHWNVSCLMYANAMFKEYKGDADVASWNVTQLRRASEMFHKCHTPKDLSNWKLFPKALGGNMLDLPHLIKMTKPCVLHWLRFIEEPSVTLSAKHPDWAEHVDTQLPLLHGLGLTPMESAMFLHKEWMEGPGVKAEVEMLELPEMG